MLQHEDAPVTNTDENFVLTEGTQAVELAFSDDNLIKSLMWHTNLDDTAAEEALPQLRTHIADVRADFLLKAKSPRFMATFLPVFVGREVKGFVSKVLTVNES